MPPFEGLFYHAFKRLRLAATLSFLLDHASDETTGFLPVVGIQFSERHEASRPIFSTLSLG
jgi:hypothetical protein